MLTLKKVNLFLSPYQLELHKGRGYYYFTSNKHQFQNSMVMVNSLNSMNLNEWILEGEMKIKENYDEENN